MRRTAIAAVVVLLSAGLAVAQVYVRPYVRRDGTMVQGHQRSRPDGNPYNNYSYPGNLNPYTGKVAPGGGSLRSFGYDRPLPRQQPVPRDWYGYR